MVQQYCHNCGKKMPQASLKFCPHCGTNLASLASTPPKEEPQKPSRASTFRQPNRERFIPQDDNDDYDAYADADGLDINISKLEVDVAIPRGAKETIGGLMAQGPVESDGFSRGNQNLSTSEIGEIIAKEGGTLRPRGKSSTDEQV